MASTLSSTLFSAAHLSTSSSIPFPARNARSAGRVSGRICVISSCQSSSSSSDNDKHEDKWVASRRDMVAGSIMISAGLFALPALALLETDDDDSLLEKVKEDRKKRIEKRGVAISFKDETESVQKAVYELSKAGQAIDGEDYGLANAVLGTTDVAWITEVKAAISKVNKNAEDVEEAQNFSAALIELQAAVVKKDLKQSKTAFVASANALEKWSSLTGLSDQIKGL